MIRREFVLLLVIFLFDVELQAQSLYETIKIEWLKPGDYPIFDKAIYPESDSRLPWVSERVSARGLSQGMVPQIQITEPAFEDVPEEEIKFFKNLPDGDFRIKSWIQTERKADFVRFEFIPVRKNPANGKLQRLVSFRPLISGIPSPSYAAAKSGKFNETSVLSAGYWYKIAVSESGVYKITFDKLKELGFDNPAEIRVFGNGGKQLPFDSSLKRTDDLIENDVYIYTGSNGVFDSGDYILFYAKGIVDWKYDAAQNMFTHELHLYSEETYYYLTTSQGVGKRVLQATAIPGLPTRQVTSYDYYTFREKDSVNLIKSGRQWAWKHFFLVLDHAFQIPLQNRVEGTPVKILSSLLVRSSNTSASSNFIIQANDETVASIPFQGVNTGNYEALYASKTLRKTEVMLTGSDLLLNYKFVPSNPAAVAWLDYVDIQARCKLEWTEIPLAFRDMESTGQNQIAQYRIENGRPGLLLWDVTDPGTTISIPYTMDDRNLIFQDHADILKEYILFDPTGNQIPEPRFTGTELGEVPNQNLHAMEVPEMLIIVQNELKDYAEELAEIHRNYDGLNSAIVSPGEIYNEFSSGKQDATAIRDFLRMLYAKSSGSNIQLKYLLLFGDGSYDNKKILTDQEFRNYLPTYQSLESLYPTRSYVTDDFFGLLDSGEGMEEGLLDIGIGRFPVKTAYEASIVVDKVRSYLSAESFGDWRNLLCFIGDDEDGNSHMRDANFLAEKVSTSYPAFNIDKIFLDAYQQVVTASGQTYPEVNRAILDRIKKGALIMNYLGHGSELGLAHENIITISDIQSWDNYDKLPLFMTATCEFSRFDDHLKPSAGEFVLINPKGGGIGLFTTTRLVYSSPNFRLNREFYDYAFQRPGGGKYRFGDLMRLTKNAVGSELNKLNFTLLADPAVTLNFPEQRIIMTEINGQPVDAFTDTLKALSHVNAKGYIADLSGRKMEDFQGILYPTVYDKSATMTTLSNDGGFPMEFDTQESILFRGKSSILNGEFEFEFIVPKDINYSVGTGKFSFYGTDRETDGSGVDQQILIGESADSLIQDKSGPIMQLFMNDTTFVYGGITNENPILLARLRDENGINTTGNGIGHDITATINGNNQNIMVLNDYYESDLDDYKAGTIRYPLTELEPGTHRIKLKVWDILNNSSETELQFEVISSGQIILKNLLNYPNPFTTQTAFYFEHNQSGISLDAQIQIYTVSGRLVKSFDYLTANETQIEAGKFRVGPVYWDGLDQYGDRIGRGTYFYRVRIRTPDGKIQEAFQKLVKL